MTIELPSSPSYRAGRWRLLSNAQRFTSPITRVSQSVARVGDLWACEMQLPPMLGLDAGPWAATMARLAGGMEAAFVRPPLRNFFQAAPGAPVVSGANQAGTTLQTVGWTPGLVIRAGTFFSVETGTFRALHLIVSTTSANGAGAAALNIRPAIRRAPLNGGALNLSSPSCEMQLEASDAEIVNLAGSIEYGGTFRFVEAVVR